jgi:hypothetical protein
MSLAHGGDQSGTLKKNFDFCGLATRKNIDRGCEITIFVHVTVRAPAIQPASTYKEYSA